MTWEELSHYHMTIVNILLNRKLEIDEQYKKDKLNGKCDNFIISLKEKLIETSYCIIRNSYPYDIDEKINHYVFWFNSDYSMVDALTIVKNIYKNNNVIIFCNDDCVKSIKSVNHYQIFILNQ